MPGDPESLGALAVFCGINFAAAIPDELPAELVLTDLKGHVTEKIELPASERTGEVSSVFLKGVKPEETGYYYIIDGIKTMDPYACRIANGICYPLSDSFDWEDEKAPQIPVNDLCIYKLHVRGFTKKAGSSVKHKGTFAGLAEKIPYITGLGFNAVELMPVYEFDSFLSVRPYADAETAADGTVKAQQARNFWGYAENNYYFAPKEEYSATGNSIREFRSLVKEFHKAGVEVFMEMYFPPKTEPFLALRAVRYWKSVYHIDGFHFIGEGTPVSWLVSDPLLKKTKLMLERVDAGWIYSGQTPKYRNLLEYNDDFLRTGRSLLKGDEGQIDAFSVNIRRNPQTHAFVNYMANVNGFTLYDMVCYDFKHNEANGEGNQDGTFQNFSWNCGSEGPSRKKNVRALRLRQLKNALCYVFLSQGVPLLYAGDEMLNTQNGNNNAYSSDNPTGWTDWSASKDAEEIRGFVKMLTALRKNHHILHMPKELKGTDYKGYGFPDISFHDSKAWVSARDYVTRTLAVLYCGMYTRCENLPDEDFFYVAYNAYWDAHPFALPVLPKGYAWYCMFITSEPGSDSQGEKLLKDQKFCECPPRTVCLLTGKKTETGKEEK